MAAVPSSYLVNHHQHFYIASIGYHCEGMRILPKGFLPFSVCIDDLAQHLNICPLGLVALQQLTYRMQGVGVGVESLIEYVTHWGL